MQFDLDKLLERTLRRERLSEDELKEIVFRVQALFVMEANVVSVPAPVLVCGDVHG